MTKQCGHTTTRRFGSLRHYLDQFHNRYGLERGGRECGTFGNLTAGMYTVSITDALGCTVDFTDQFELVLPEAISGTVATTDLVCQGDTDASISFTLNPRNVSPLYRYYLNRYSDAAGTDLIERSPSSTLASFTNLGAGFYSISVADDMGCDYESAIETILDPLNVTGQLLTEQSLGCQVAPLWC